MYRPVGRNITILAISPKNNCANLILYLTNDICGLEPCKLLILMTLTAIDNWCQKIPASKSALALRYPPL